MNTKNQEKFNYSSFAWTEDSLVEIVLDAPDDFLKVKETLTRIGITNRHKENELQQLCHILYKFGRYFIVHFKELYLLDGLSTNLTHHDIERRNMIITLLSDWGLLTIIDTRNVVEKSKLSSFRIVPHKDKHKWNLVSKYTFKQTKGN